MNDRPGQRDPGQGPIERAFGTSALGNSTAFGYSIMITVSFGVLSRVQGSPTLPELFAYAGAAAIGVAAVDAAVTRGFRRRVERTPSEVAMLGSALDVLSVMIAIAAVLRLGELLGGALAWGLAAFAASIVYMVAQALDVLAAELTQSARGDPDADPGDDPDRARG